MRERWAIRRKSVALHQLISGSLRVGARKPRAGRPVKIRDSDVVTRPPLPTTIMLMAEILGSKMPKICMVETLRLAIWRPPLRQKADPPGVYSYVTCGGASFLPEIGYGGLGILRRRHNNCGVAVWHLVGSPV
jgi:hypothetical protein